MWIEFLPLIFFATIFLALLFGYPVAFTIGGVSAIFGLVIFDIDFFYLLILRVYGMMNNYVLLAVPLFVYMGIMLEKSGLAENLLETMAILFGRFKGGLAISVILVGAMLAASTGIVGATVITMGLISLPTMLKRNYSKTLATGVIASAGTLGQIIPPSVVLVLLATVLNVSVGKLFTAAVLPSIILVLFYIAYVILISLIKPGSAPAMPEEIIQNFKSERFLRKAINAFVLPFLLILAVLGSIFAGIASPTEASAIGAIGATLLTILQKKFTFGIMKTVGKETMYLTCMVFAILVGATAFSLVFRGMEGDRLLIDLIRNANLSPSNFLVLLMLSVFIAGFFIDFIEIIFIIVPVVTPVLLTMGIDLIWIGILLAMNLQTSFLTPPFGFSLFYLKSVAPPEVKTSDLYKGVLPFVCIQLTFLALLIMFPEIIDFLPSLLSE